MTSSKRRLTTCAVWPLFSSRAVFVSCSVRAQVEMKLIRSCKILCKESYSKEELSQFAERIEEEYRINMCAMLCCCCCVVLLLLCCCFTWYAAQDHRQLARGHQVLHRGPLFTRVCSHCLFFVRCCSFVVTQAPASDGGESEYVTHYEKGFALGFVGSEEIPNTSPGVKYINNHIRFIIYYHEDKNNFAGYRVVGFEVEPFRCAAAVVCCLFFCSCSLFMVRCSFADCQCTHMRSVKHKVDGKWKNNDETQLQTCNQLSKVTRALEPQPVSGDALAANTEIIWTYDVQVRISLLHAHIDIDY